MSQFIKQIIKEEIGNIVLDSKKESEELKNKIDYLKNFPLLDFINKDGKRIWFYGRKIDSYKLKFYVINQHNQWSAKLVVIWKKETKFTTANAGKDAEKKFGQFNTIEELAKDINLKLNNNPLFSPTIYHDDWELNMDKEAIVLLKRLKEIGEQMSSIKDKHFTDIKKIYNDIKNFNDDKEFLKYCQEIAPEEGEKQVLIYHLQKMHNIGFYNGMNVMRHNG